MKRPLVIALLVVALLFMFAGIGAVLFLPLNTVVGASFLTEALSLLLSRSRRL